MKPGNFLWHAAPGGLQPVKGETDVFCAALDVPSRRLEELMPFLSEDERQRAGRFYWERDRHRFLTGRGLLREILGALLKVSPTSLVFSYGAFGKPQIIAPAGAPALHFNLAHSDSVAVYAMANHELGVDLERLRPMDEVAQIAARFFSSREERCLLMLPSEQRQTAFFQGWTRKEAYLKALGRGLGDDLNQIEVSLTRSAAPELVSGPNPLKPWFLHTLFPTEEFVGALALPQQDSHVNYWTWNGLH